MAAASPIALVFALREEARPFLALNHLGQPLNRQQSLVLPPIPGRAGALVVWSGAGSANAASCMRALLGSGPPYPSAVIACGFAGGLKPEAAPGVAIVADSVCDSHGHSWTADAALASAVTRAAESPLVTRILSSDTVLLTPAEKSAACATYGAGAVDMETAAIAAAAGEHGVPWCALRCITDGVEDYMPLDFNRLSGPGGDILLPRIIGATLLRPWVIPGLIRLGARSSAAARRLAQSLSALLAAADPA